MEGVVWFKPGSQATGYLEYNACIEQQIKAENFQKLKDNKINKSVRVLPFIKNILFQ